MPLLTQSITHHRNILLFPCGESGQSIYLSMWSLTLLSDLLFHTKASCHSYLLMLYLLVTLWRCCSFVPFRLLSLYQDPLHLQLITSRPHHTLILLEFANEACLPLHNSPKETLHTITWIQAHAKMLTTLTDLYCIIFQL